jgi:hypothetical protein
MSNIINYVLNRNKQAECNTTEQGQKILSEDSLDIKLE